MLPLCTGAQMRAIDAETIEGLGVPASLLMEHAGRGVADEVRARSAPGSTVAVLCGSGNNGGDGYVCARWLRELGWDARVYLARGRRGGEGEAALHLRLYERLGGPVVEITDAASLAAAREEILGAPIVVDALLGTGLERDVTGHMAQVIELVNQARGLTISVDVPSGLGADDGRTFGVAVRADVTVTLALRKLGLVTHPGSELAGEVRVVDIGIPRRLTERHGVAAFLLEEEDAAALVPRRARGAHKGSHGHVLVVAGSPDKPGAAALCTGGALRGGAGLVTLAAPPAVHAAVVGLHPEAMVTTFDAGATGAEQALAGLADGKRALVIGPGLSTTPAAGRLVRHAIESLTLPIVVDADALNHLAGGWPSTSSGPRVLTPHPGEAARLLGSDTRAVQADRVGAARRLAAMTSAVVVLKGARTVVAAPDGTVTLNPTGNPGMGTGGTGDVLAGVIGALLGQGLAPLPAARLGVYVHGRAGDLAAAERGEVGLVAGDLLGFLPAALAILARGAGQSVIAGRVPPATDPHEP